MNFCSKQKADANLKGDVNMQKHPITIVRSYSSKSEWGRLSKCLADDHNYLSVGDCITDKLKDGREFTVEVVALSPYDPNTVAFVFKDCVCDYHMNDNATNDGGWRDSKMREWLSTELFELLPDELQNAIKPRTIRQKQNGDIISSVDWIWLPSHTEVFGEEIESDVDDVQFEWFKNYRSRVKLDTEGKSAPWWERSPDYNNYTAFCTVYANGFAYNSYAHSSSGVAPAFII